MERRITRYCCCILVILVGSAAIASAQVPEFPDSLRQQEVIAQSERFSSTHVSSLGVDYRLDREGISGIVRSYLVSSTTLLGIPETRDRIDILSDLEIGFTSPFRLFTLIEGTLTSDPATTGLLPGLNNTGAAFIGVGGRYVDSLGNRLGIAAGGAYNRQLNVEDAGGGLYGEMATSGQVGGYDYRASGVGRWQNITPRKNANLRVSLDLFRSYDEVGSLGATGSYELYNSDLYIRRREEDIATYGGPAYEAIQRRQENRFTFGPTFRYLASDDLLFDADFLVAGVGIGRFERGDGIPNLPRDPDPFRRDQRDLAVFASFGSRMTSERLLLSGRIAYRNGEQRNLVEPLVRVSDSELRQARRVSAKNDFVSQQLMFSGEALWQPTSRDSLGLSGSVGIYRYDTPDTTNNFDKDEQTIRTEIRFARRFGPELHLELTGQVFMTHLVYLFGENSNDNNWNRVFRFSPSTYYVLPGILENRLTTEVVANYTEYDFEGRTGDVRGRSFRELGLRDSLTIYVTSTLGLTMAGEMRIGERGSFSWKEFAESPLEQTKREGIESELIAELSENVRFGVGGRLSRVKILRANPRGDLFPFSDRTSIGPSGRIEARLSPKSEVVATGWWEHRFDESTLIGKTPWLFLTLRMKL